MIPFITETLWAKLPPFSDGSARGTEFLTTSGWPVVRQTPAAGGDAFELVRNAVLGIRQIRNEYKVKPGKSIAVELWPSDADRATAPALTDTIGALTRATVSLRNGAPSSTLQSAASGAAAHQVLAGGTEVVIALSELTEAESAEDTAKECARLKAELEHTQKILSGVTAKLSNESFTSRAKPEVVDGARAQERDLAQKVDALTRKVEALCGTR